MSFRGNHILYRLFDDSGTLLYVGITNDVRQRFAAHATTQPWWGEVADCRTEFFSTRTALDAAERVAIQSESPRYNKRLRAPRPRGPVLRSRIEDLVVPIGEDFGLVVATNPVVVVHRDGSVLGQAVGNRWRVICSGRLSSAILRPGHEACSPPSGRKNFCQVFGASADNLARALGL